MQLIGILIIVIGFALKLDVLAVVLVSGIVTGLVAGLPIREILEILGSSFVSNRVMSTFLIIFPIIAIIERYGLKERAATLISSIKKATAGKVLSIYMVIRSIGAAFNLRLGGHVQFIRPLILPMSNAAAIKDKGSDLNEKEEDELKGLNGAIENYGNFFAQNCFPAAGGVVLMQGVLIESGFEVSLGSIALNSIPIMVIAIIVSIVQAMLYDRKLKKEKKLVK